MEDPLLLWRTKRPAAALLFILLAGLLGGCATGGSAQLKQNMLTTAGFWTADPNAPQTQLLMQASTPGQFSSYAIAGKKYYLYPDAYSNTLYMGDEAAYQRYVAMQQDKRLCRSLDVDSGTALWECVRDLQRGK
jgi:hypothetical protein